MRWFKHMSAARRDEKISSYLDECKRPLEAYGFWWALLEVVAEQMKAVPKDAREPDSPDYLKCDCEYTLSQWARELYCHHHLVTTYLGKLEGNCLVTVEKSGSKVKVTIPNLLKYRDEYTRKSGLKSGVNPDNVPSRSRTEKNKKDFAGTNAVATSNSKTGLQHIHNILNGKAQRR